MLIILFDQKSCQEKTKKSMKKLSSMILIDDCNPKIIIPLSPFLPLPPLIPCPSQALTVIIIIFIWKCSSSPFVYYSYWWPPSVQDHLPIHSWSGSALSRRDSIHLFPLLYLVFSPTKSSDQPNKCRILPVVNHVAPLQSNPDQQSLISVFVVPARLDSFTYLL